MSEPSERENQKRIIRESGVWLADRIAWLEHDDDDERVARFYHRTQHLMKVRDEMREFERQQLSRTRDARLTGLIHLGFVLALAGLVLFAVLLH